VTGPGHVARWSGRHPARLVITAASGDAVASFTVARPGDRPTVGLLDGTGWSPYPGAEWQEEDPPGHWSIDVFHGHSAPATAPGCQRAPGTPGDGA